MAIYPGLSTTVRNEFATNSIYDFSPGTQVWRDAMALKAMGMEWVRINYPSFDNVSAVAGMKTYALFYKSMGFKCRVGLTAAPGPVNLTRWNAFIASIPAFAQWAQDNQMDAFCVGNEEATHHDQSTLLNTQVRTDMLAMATTCQAIFTRGPVVYDASAGEMVQTWHPFGLAGLGDLDLIGHNQYDSLSNFSSKLRVSADMFGARLDVTEWNIDNGFNGTNMKTERNFEKDMLARLQVCRDLRAAGKLNNYYFFGLRDGGNGIVANSYALLKTNGDMRIAYNAVFTSGRTEVTV